MREFRRDYHDQLAELHDRVTRMGSAVAEAIPLATAALLHGDTDLADRVVGADAVIDGEYPWVEREVFDIVARQAPVARDLRLVIATQRVAANIERCGDLVSSIARRAGRIESVALAGTPSTLLEEMGTEVERLFRLALHAYAVLDEDVATQVPRLDDGIDDLQRRLLRVLVTAGTESVESVVDLALVARFYERIGDHAVVIAERVRFVSSGEMDAGDRDESG